MSLFDFEIPHVQGVIFDPAKPPSGTGSSAGASGVPNGTIWYDVTNAPMGLIPASTSGSGLYLVPNVQTTAVVNTNATTATALMTYAFPAGSLNTKGRIVDIFGAGEYTTDSGTARTFTLAVTFGDGTNTRTLATWTTAATTASQTGMPWNFDLAIAVTTAGTSGTLFGHGLANVTLGASAAGALTSYNDVNTANSSALDLTKAITMSITQLYSGSNAGNTFTQDLMQVSLAY